MTDWNYQKILSLLRERENYGGKQWYEIRHWHNENTFLIRFTKDTLLIGEQDYMTLFTPVKNSYMTETESLIYYKDLEDVRITHVPFEINFKLKGINSHIRIVTPTKWTWGVNVKSFPVYCENAWKEILGEKND